MSTAVLSAMTVPEAQALIAVAVENEAQRQWLPTVAFRQAGLDPVFFHLAGLRPELPVSSLEVACAVTATTTLPDFAELVRAFETQQPVACFVAGDGALAKLTRMAAELLGIPAFRMVATAEELQDVGPRSHRSGGQPDLCFVGAEDLLPSAMNDPRYGSGIWFSGLPGADPLAQERILAVLRLWVAGALPPPPELSIVVPAFKEAKNLPMVCDRLVETIEAGGMAAEILLVDDASPDDTYRVALAQAARSPRVRALTKPLPRGMGNSIRYGLRHARGRFIAVTMGDGSDEVARIPEMLAKVRDQGYGLAIGSRYRQRRNYETVPRLYRFWSWCFRLTTRLFIGFKLSDYTNAFRLFDRRIFERYGPESGGFEISPEITFRAWFATRRVAEVDVRHLKRASGQSSFSFLRAGPGYGKILIKAFVNRLTGRWFILDW